jgi:hypothetical protein
LNNNISLNLTNKQLAFGVIAVILSSLVLITSGITVTLAQEGTVVRDSAVVLLDGKTLPANDFIHLYDTTPYMVMNGHIAAKLPCNENSESPINVLIGQAPNLKAADLELVTELSKAGEACLYHVDVESQPGAENGTITDIAIQNPTNDAVEFGSSATVVIGVNEIAPIAEEAGAMGNMTMSNSTG